MASDRNINLLNEMTQDNTEALRRTLDPMMRLNQTAGDLRSVQYDNINEVRYLRNTLLQQNNVANKLKDSITKADSINVKGLGQNITLQKIIDQNSKAITDSSVGYLRAAEGFIDNFAAGIRRTEGGTLRLTEQLILTNQSQEAFRSVNNQLLSESGRNYNALSEFNDAVLETADTYTISTDKLLDGINKLMGDIRQFSLFGPQVADGIAAASTELLGKFQGLNEGQLTSLFRILKPGLEGRATREVLGVQALQETMATGNIDAAQLEAGIMQIAQKIDAFTAGASPDVAFAQLKAIGLSPEDSANFMAMRRTLDAGAEDNKKLQATQKEQLDTIKNQTELANKYYEKIAPQTLNATVSLLAPMMQTAQAINFIAASQQGLQSLGNLAGLPGGGPPAGTAPGGAPTPTPVVRDPATGVVMNQTKEAVTKQTNVFKRGFNNLKNDVGKLAGNVKSVLRPSNLKNFVQTPVGLGGLTMGGTLAAQALGGDKTVAGQAVGGVTDIAGMAAMAKTLVPGLQGLTGPGIAGAIVAGTMDSLDTALGNEAGGTGDTLTDITKYAGYGAALGSIIPGVGTVIGGVGGAIVGGIAEIFDFDGDREVQEAQLKEQREQKRLQERQLRQAERAKIAKSDFVLMGIVDRVQRQQAELIRSGNAESVAAMKALTEAVKQGNVDRKSISKDKRGDMNK